LLTNKILYAGLKRCETGKRLFASEPASSAGCASDRGTVPQRINIVVRIRLIATVSVEEVCYVEQYYETVTCIAMYKK
jgi:hypothetical protein